MQHDKFKIMITVGLSYIRKHSWWLLACSQFECHKKIQKSNIGWPQQPPTEKMLKFNLFYDTLAYMATSGGHFSRPSGMGGYWSYSG